MDGREPRTIPRAEPREAGHRTLHRAHHLCSGIEHSGSSNDDCNRSRSRYCRADGDGRAKRRQIRKIFVLQGVVVSAAGTAAGLLLGYALAWVADKWRLIPLNPEVYAIPYVPFHANALDSVWIVAAALAISVAATIVPARAAASILPVQILRFE